MLFERRRAKTSRVASTLAIRTLYYFLLYLTIITVAVEDSFV
jgi:hypothetical protein